MRQTYRFRLYPNQKQANDIRRTCSAVRFLYNKILEERTDGYRKTGKWAKINTEKYKLLPWMTNTDPSALLAAENQIKTAYDHFFKILRTKKDKYRPDSLQRATKDPSYRLMDCDLVGYPKFKKKRTTAESYQTNPDEIRIEDNIVFLPVVGKVKAKIHRPLPEGAEILKCTILKKRSGKYFILLLLDIPGTKEDVVCHDALGVVFSPGNLIKRSDGKEVYFRHTDPALEKRIQKAYQTLKRRTPGSHRYEKQREYLAKLYEKRVEQRRDDLHKTAQSLAADASVICMESPDVMARASDLRRQGLYDIVHDEAWWKFSKLVEQKVKAKGNIYWRIDRRHVFFAICSKCGHVSKPRSNRNVFICPACGSSIGREENSVQVLYQQAKQILEESTPPS